MTGNLLNELLQLGAKSAHYREDGLWFHHLTNFPGALFDKNGYIIFQSKNDYLNHPKLRHTERLHVYDGIESINGYSTFTEDEWKKIILGIRENIDEASIRIIRQLEVIVRDIELVKKIKRLYNNTCQICGTRLYIGKGKYYSEGHHIQPLGKPHNGPDNIENMLCVCPNCHIQLDFGAVDLDLTKFNMVNHPINANYILYHSTKIYLK